MHSPQFDKPFYINDVLVDPLRHVVERDGKLSKISPRSLDILKCLIRSENKSITYQALADHVWGEPTSEKIVYQQVAFLRKVLGDDPNNPTFIKTKTKLGYQLIAEVNFPGEERLFRLPGRRPPGIAIGIIFVTGIAIAIAAIAIFVDVNQKADPQRQVLLDAIEHLRYPQRIVALEVSDLHDPQGTMAPESNAADENDGLIETLELLIEYHLDQNTELHIVHVPKPSDRHRLIQHFSGHGSFDYILQPTLSPAGGQDKVFEIRLDIIEPQNGNMVREIRIPVRPGEASLSLARVEERLMAGLQQTGLIDKRQKPFLINDVENHRILIETARILPRLGVAGLEEKKQILLQVHQVLMRNPENLLAYSIMWRTALSIILSNSEFDVAALLSFLKPHVHNLRKYYPDYHESHHFISKYYAWNQEHAKSLASISMALEKKPFNLGVLIGFSWNLKTQGEDSLAVDEINYALNPFSKVVMYFYRDALLAANKAGQAVDMLNHYMAWDLRPRDWRLEAQVQASDEKLREFADWYKSRFSRIEGSPEQAMRAKQTDRDKVPSKYIGYMLLNAGQPERARFWQQYGREDQAVYFDIRIIDLFADIWQGDWKLEKWRMLNDLAEERRAFQNTTDKLNIFYFHYYSGLYQHAGQYLLEIFPEFADSNSGSGFAITRDNFRYVVYYAEIQERQGIYGTAKRINQMLKDYLTESDHVTRRDVDFGIADVEFYAMLGDREKALELLSRAILDQGWLPNAFWRWPPIEHNISLKSLRGLPEFDALRDTVHGRLSELCFGGDCGQTPLISALGQHKPVPAHVRQPAPVSASPCRN